jgi:sulfate adenylyltransferase subunit 1 (EFTu-like GTPase family)
MDQNLVTNPERGSKQVEESGENEAVAQLPAQKSPVRGFEELLVHLAVVIKHKIDDSKVEPPLQCDGKELTVAEERYWQGQIQCVLVDQGNQIVVLSHDAAGNVDSVKSFF